MKIIALDIGDAWTGIAISDSLGMFARPYQTIATPQLDTFLTTLIEQESLGTIVVGYPKTMRGTRSEQTKKVEAMYDHLKQQFPAMQWVLWDERLSSKRAEALKKSTSAQDKKFSHARAAAFILSSYLDYRALHQPAPDKAQD